MNAARALLGVHVPGHTIWHRMPVWLKYVAFLAITLPPAVVIDWRWAVASLVVALAAVASTRATLRVSWGLPTALMWLIGVLAAFHVVSGAWETAMRVTCLLLTALYASRIILITTPWPHLIDALVALTRPLACLGFSPERFSLAVSVMVRSIPWVAAAFDEVRTAGRARGLERNPLALVTPVVVRTVAYARSTGEALAARGLGED